MSLARQAIQDQIPPGLSRFEKRKLENRLIAKERYLASLARQGTVSAGARAAGVSRMQVTLWRQTDESFNVKEQEARDAFADMLEAEAIKRGREYSDQLLMFLLKGLRPDRYRDRMDLQVTPVIKAVAGFDPGDVV